jgi:hypothetical protein
MSRIVAHWGPREWRKNQDDLVQDPERPQAFPGTYPMDLLGRIRVRLAAEERNLVAYGFRGQRVELPSKSVGAVRAVRAFSGGSVAHGRALLVLDHDNRILLRADGLWDTNGDVKTVCLAARAPRPSSHGFDWTARERKLLTPRFDKAPGYVKLHTRPRGIMLRRLATLLLFLVTMTAGFWVGLAPGVLLPEWLGAVRALIGLVGTALGIAGGIWLGAAISHVCTDAVRWAAASWMVGRPAPGSRFFGRRAKHGERWRNALDVGLVFLCVALIGWGPAVGITSLVHGFRDASLVARLRADGAQVQGTLIDVPQYTGDSSNESLVDVPTLSFISLISRADSLAR